MLIGIVSHVNCCYNSNRMLSGKRMKGKGKGEGRWKGMTRGIKQKTRRQVDPVSISSEALLRVGRESVTCGKS